MKKLIAVAALIVTAYAAPTVSVQAASAYPSNCLILPLLQADCRDMIKADVSRATGAATMSTKKVASTTTMAAKSSVKVPFAWWSCKRAEGGKYLLSCE